MPRRPILDPVTVWILRSEGLSFGEIAKQFGVKRQAARQAYRRLLARAVERLRELIPSDIEDRVTKSDSRIRKALDIAREVKSKRGRPRQSTNVVARPKA